MVTMVAVSIIFIGALLAMTLYNGFPSQSNWALGGINLDLGAHSSLAKFIGTMLSIIGPLFVTLYKGLRITIVWSLKLNGYFSK